MVMRIGFRLNCWCGFRYSGFGFCSASARVVGDNESVWGDADLVLKVKGLLQESMGDCMRVWFYVSSIWLLMRRADSACDFWGVG